MAFSRENGNSLLLVSLLHRRVQLQVIPLYNTDKMTVTEISANNSASEPGRIRVNEINPGTFEIDIPREGFSYKALFTLLIIFFWLLMILVWSVLLFQYGKSWSLVSIPFWILGIVTLRLSLKTIFASQQITVNNKELTILRLEGSTRSHVTFKVEEIESVTFVESAYKSLAGITRKGIFPAVISKNEAFGFGERSTKAEKQFLTGFINSVIRQ